MRRRFPSPFTFLLLLLAAGCQGPGEPPPRTPSPLPAVPPAMDTPPELPPEPAAPAETPDGLPSEPPVPETEDAMPDPPPAARDGTDAPGEESKEPESSEAEGLLTSFEGMRPALRSMPVPVFPLGVDFEAVVPGWVDFSVHIDAQGRVTEVEFLEASHPALVEPAREALEEARFEPVLAPIGMPVPVEFRHRVEF